MDVEEQYLDVLQNIEFGIIRVYREYPEMTDWQALDAVQALIRLYQAQAQGRPEPQIALQPLALEVFDSTQAMCEWRLGRSQLEPAGDAPVDTQADAGHGTHAGTQPALPDWSKAVMDWLTRKYKRPPISESEKPPPNNSEPVVGPDPISLDEIIVCLKRIRKSIQFWSKQGGRQGYLNYVDGFIL